MFQRRETLEGNLIIVPAFCLGTLPQWECTEVNHKKMVGSLS